MEKQGITTLEDFSRFVAGLSVQTTTPGQNTIVFRGVSDGGGFLVDPTAAIYLDEQPMSQTTWAPDIYPVDLARVEALAGPQSTLYGASSQSGAIASSPTNLTTETQCQCGCWHVVNQMEEGLRRRWNGQPVPLSDTVAIRLSGFNLEMPDLSTMFLVLPLNLKD